MRSIACIAFSGAFAGVAAAQDAIVIEGQLGEAVKALPRDRILNDADARCLNSAAMSSGGLDLVEKALFDKLATGQPVTVSVETSQLTLKTDADARRIASTLTGKLDLPAMWADSARLGELVEISRWS